LADRLGLNTGATSYHLRQLAEHGFVEEQAERGNGRDRWWRAAHQSTWTDEAPEPAARDAVDAFAQAVVVVHTEQLQRAVEERPLLSDEWRRASTVSDWGLQLAPQDAAELLARLVELFEEFSDREPAPGDRTDGTGPMVYQVHAFPRPGTVAGDPS
jgi:predicted ArsR family transcriptional regulator